MTNYYCKHCHRVVARDSTKQWIRSWCSGVIRTVHLRRLDLVKLPPHIVWADHGIVNIELGEASRSRFLLP